VLAEFNGSVSQLRFAACCVISYTPRDIKYIPVHSLVDLFPEELDIIEDGFTTFKKKPFCLNHYNYYMIPFTNPKCTTEL